MARPSAVIEALWAVLFAAVCAWVLAGLYSRAEAPVTVTLQTAAVMDSAELEGIVIRSERSLRFDRGFRPTAENGRRVPGGGELARGEDGSLLLCESSAVYFDACDGYEYLSPEDISPLSVASLGRLLSARREAPGDGRLVADYVWYYAALTDHSRRLPSSGSCRVLFDGFDSPVRAAVLSLSAAEKGKAALLLRLTEGGEYLSLRRTGARLIFSEYAGLGVPLEALRADEAGDKFVYALSSGAFSAQRVDILYTGADFVLVSSQAKSGGLREGSRVLVTGGRDNGYS